MFEMSPMSQAGGLFLHLPIAASSFCCSPLQTSISCCLSSFRLLTRVFCIHCCAAWCPNL